MADEISAPPLPPQTGVNAPSPMVSGVPLASPVSPLDAVIRRATGQAAPVADPVAQSTLPIVVPPPQGIDIPAGTEVETHGIDIPVGTEVEKPPTNLSEVHGQPFNPLTDFSVQGIVDAAKTDNNFDPINLLRSAPPELRNNPEVRQKVAEAFVELWKASENNPLLGVTFEGLLKGAGSIVSGLAQFAYHHGHVPGALIRSEFENKEDAKATREGARTEAAQNILSLQLAGAQLGMQGEQLAKWVARHAFGRAAEPNKWTKPLANYSPEDKMDALNDAMAAKDIQEKILTGKSLKGADKLAVPLNPHAIEAEAAGNPFAFELMGKAFHAPTAAVSKLIPAGATAAISEAMPRVVGKTLSAVGKTAEVVGKPLEKTSEMLEKTKIGEYLLAHLLGPPGVLLGKGIEKAGKLLPKTGEKLAGLGEQLSSGEITSDYAQLAKNAAEALPESVVNVLSGAALDVGLAETTTQTPAEREGLGLGALLGAAGAVKGAGKRIIGGQLVGERAGAFTPEMTQRLHDTLGTGYQHKQFENAGQAQNWFKTNGVSDTEAAALTTDKVGGTVKLGDQDYTYAIGKSQTPHEIVHAFKDSLPPEQKAKLDAATLKNYSPEELQQAKQQYASQLDPKGFKAGKSAEEILSKVTQEGETPDQYIVNELQAENLMTYIKSAGPGLKAKRSIPRVLAKGAAEVVSALGGEPLETERSQADALKFPLKYKEVKGLVKAAKEKITPESVAAAEEKAKHETNAEDVAALGEEHPDKTDILTTLGQAQANKGGVKLTYSGATGEAASDLSSDLPGIDADARRAIVEAERESPAEARTPWWKTFFPDRTFETKGGKLQSGGWLPAIFTANAYRFAKSAATTPEIRALSPYEINPQTNFFTPEAYDALQKDVQVAVKNWKDGRTASGVPLQVPETTRGQSGGKIFQPPLGTGGGALDNAKADFISHLMGHKLPNTARLTEGVFPLNVAGQDVSRATMPGRVEALRPAGAERGIFGEAAKTEKGLAHQRELAQASGVEGRQLLEVNPFRLKLEAAAKAAGVDAPKPVNAYQRLNLDRVLHAEHAPGDFRGNTLTQAAGFEPRFKNLRELQDRKNAVDDEITMRLNEKRKELDSGKVTREQVLGTLEKQRNILESQIEKHPDVSEMISPPNRAVRFEPEKDRATTRMTYPKAHEMAKEYAKENGLDEPVSTGNRKYPEELMKKMADALEDSPHSAKDPETQEAYHTFTREILKQAQKIIDAGIDVEPYTGKGEPYKNSEEMVKDVANNKHLFFLKTEKAFGGTSEDQIAAAKYADNLLLQSSGMTLHGYDASVNDVLRFTHDFFGHTPEGYQFGPQGEFNAFLTHAQMFPKNIQKALISELLMQTSWFFGNRKLRRADGSLPKRGEADFTPLEKRDFADPKNVIPSDELASEVAQHVQDVVLSNKLKTLDDSADQTAAKQAAGKFLGRFEPTTEAGKKAEEKGLKFKLQDFGGGVMELSLSNADGQQVSHLSVSQISPKLANVDSVATVDDYRKQGLAEALYRELGTHLQKKGIKVLGGVTVNDGPRKVRERVFGPPVHEKQFFGGPTQYPPGKGASFDARRTFSAVRPDVKFEPSSEAGSTPKENQEARKAWREKGVDSPFFKKWFGDSKVVDEDKKPLVVYHGTTHQFDSFDMTKTNPESFWGPGNYFTSDESDASHNYGHSNGPDLKNRIERRIEELQALELPGQEKPFSVLEKQATDELVGPEEQVIPAYLKMENPVVFADKGGTQFEYTYDEENGTEEGSAMDLYNALHEVAFKYDVDGSELWSKITENGADFSAQDVSKALRASYDVLGIDPETNKYIVGEFIQKLFRKLGFDGIIQKDAQNQFPGMFKKIGVEMADHYVAFDPEQVKSAENEGTFSPKDPRYKFQPGVDKTAKISDNDPMKESVEKTVRSAFAIQRAQPKRKQDSKGLEQVVGPRKISLTHISSNPSLTEIDPAFFGTGKANRNDTRGGHKSYWFVKGSPLEADTSVFGLGGNHQYEANITGDNIYDLSHDKEDPQGYFSTINREEADSNLKKAGYRGVLVDTADGRKVVLLYDKQKVKHVGSFKGSRAQPSLNAPEITQDIFKNLVPGEGFTYSPFKRELLKSGYAVSIYPERSDIIDPSELNPARVEKFIEDNKDLLTRSESSVGGWYDPESGKVYLDVSFTTPSRKLAEFAGKEYNQKAVGDLAKYAAKEPGEIPTGGNGEALPDMMAAHKRADELVKDFNWEQPASDEAIAEQELMPGLGTRAPLSSKDIGEMTKAELARHFPEALLPKRRGDLTDYGITDSPLAKAAGSREKAVHAYADKLESFAKDRLDTPEFQDGLAWYSEFVPMLKKVYGKLHETMAQLLAATSPRNSPTPNFALSNDALEGYKTGRFDKQIAKYLDGVKLIEGDKWESWYNKQRKAGKLVKPRDNPTPEAFMAEWIDWHNLEPRQSNGKLYGMHSVPVLQVLAGNWLNANTGPKTLQFVKNLLGTHQGATIDVWAARTMRRLGFEGYKDKWRILPGNETGVSEQDFHFSQEAFAEASRRLGISPDSLQGALWFAEKKLWAERGWGRLDLGDFRKEIAKVEMLNRGIQQRLAQSKADKKPTAQELELDLVSPRPSK